MEKELSTPASLAEEAAVFARGLAPRAAGATLVTLSGELGAGKTSFTQGIARTLGVTDAVTSPTFVLEKIYMLPENAPFRRFVHIDAYRLKSGAELGTLGFDEIMQDRDTLVCLEWPERVSDALPKAAAAVTLAVSPQGGRTIFYA